MKSFVIFILLFNAVVGTEMTNSSLQFDEGEIEFIVAISPTQTQSLHFDQYMQLEELHFDKNLPTVFVVHGWQNPMKSPTATKFIDSFREGLLLPRS